IAQEVDGLDADALLDLSDRFKQKQAPAAVVLGTLEDGKVHLVANFDNAVADRVSASDVVRAAAAIVGGGGGGRPAMARAGGKDPERLPDALAEAERLIVGALGGGRASRSTTALPRRGAPSPTPPAPPPRPRAASRRAAPTPRPRAPPPP